MIRLNIFTMIFLLVFSCKQATLNNPLEGAGGILIGFKQRTSIAIIVSNLPSSIDEEATITVQVKLGQKIDSETIMTISPENNLLQVNSLSNAQLKFTPENYNVDQNITFTLLASDKISPIDIGINFSAPGVSSSRFVISGNYKFSRKLNFSGVTSLAEETTGSFKITLRKKPQSNVTVIFSSNSTSAISISPATLSFTPNNYNIEQTILVTMNDIYNDNRTYTIAGTSDGEVTNYSLSIIDNDYALVNLSLGQANNSGKNPSLYIDSANNRFYVAARNGANGNRPAIYRCDSLNGTNCSSYTNFSASYTANAGYGPFVTYDSSSRSLYTVFYDFSGTGTTRAMKVDGDDATAVSSASITYGLGFTPTHSHAMLTSTGRILFIDTGTNTTLGIECNSLDLTACTASPYITFAVQSTQVQNIFGSRGFRYDSANAKILGVVTGEFGADNTQAFLPRGFVSTTAGSTVQDLMTTPLAYFGYTPDLEIDTINNRLIISTFDYSGNRGGAGNPSLMFCDRNMTASLCTYKQIAPTSPYPSYHPKLLWDSVNRKILIITYNGLRSKIPYLHHCDETGSNCTEADVSRGGGQAIADPDSSVPNFDAGIDTVNNRAILVFADATTGKLYMIRFGLGGF